MLSNHKSSQWLSPTNVLPDHLKGKALARRVSGLMNVLPQTDTKKPEQKI